VSTLLSHCRARISQRSTAQRSTAKIDVEAFESWTGAASSCSHACWQEA
jgi:hypothetical protein